ncbi:CCA tRNA nucleotidyltransferase [Candidatus Micrarchaeota archaeon]|nr:CCA tRNA nucleotidyltransferase [Candidatus Micrarchaeota archaeon]
MDIFVMFDKKLPKEEMKSEVENLMLRAFPGTVYQMNYAEHPYVRFHIGGRRVDLVPAYKMKSAEERLTAVDRSVLHTAYVLKNLKKSRRKDVLLLKQLLKANGLYGAEIRVGGFSGYLCELLAVRYGSFGRLMKEAAKWKLPVVIDLKKYYRPKDKDGVLKKFGMEFIVIDPTDRNRNVAAALSGENLKKFVSLCRRFDKKPSENFFFRKPETFEEKIRRMGGVACVVEMPKAEAVDDVLWGQLKRFMKMLEAELADFEIKDVFADSNGTVKIGIIAGKRIAGGIVEREGPPLKMKKHADSFRRAHKGERIIKRKGRLVAFVKTRDRKLENEVRAMLRENQGRFNHLPLAKAAVGCL